METVARVGNRELGVPVFQVRQQRFGVDVAFAAEYFVAVDRELIEKITRFVPRLGRKLRQDRLQIRHLIGRHLEVRMQTDESRKVIHIFAKPFIVSLSGADQLLDAVLRIPGTL